ncbi:hypothetical protein SAMN04488128_103781 [Chitinophaga eiseniae]|uniref:Uncharacterized protein n=1 Tax=Chitinophaga eiseniae TaxID=634771 RepID=A0A1T4SYH1_9BACT|nr:hypothetical protein [Chitinophaga eiseniae]SKA33162.1 hypothetical protein SAMN04488128_103781 [Chitinophaga eiseniae]
MKNDSTYPGLEYKASELSAYASSTVMDVFVLSLKNQEIKRFMPDNPQRFRAWLDANNIRDINKQELKPAPEPDARRIKRGKWF